MMSNAMTVASTTNYAAFRADLQRDGAVRIPHGFAAEEMTLVNAAFDWTLTHPGPGAAKRYTFEPGTFYETTGYFAGLRSHRVRRCICPGGSNVSAKGAAATY